MGGSGSESSRAIKLTPDGSALLVAGKTTSYGNGSFDAILLSYTLGGTLNWSAVWGGKGSDEPHDLALDGGYAYVAGQTTSYGSGKEDAFLARFNISKLVPEFPAEVAPVLILVAVLFSVAASKSLVRLDHAKRRDSDQEAVVELKV